jgi:hypothetical protein
MRHAALPRIGWRPSVASARRSRSRAGSSGEIQREAARAFEALVRAAGAGTRLELIRARPGKVSSAHRRLVSRLDPDVSLALISLGSHQDSAIGSSNIIAARDVELEAVEGRRRTGLNWVISNQLSDAVWALSRLSNGTRQPKANTVVKLGRA